MQKPNWMTLTLQIQKKEKLLGIIFDDSSTVALKTCTRQA